MIAKTGAVGVALVLALAACGSDDADTASPPSTTTIRSTEPTATTQPPDFPAEVFAAISEEPVSEELAAELQAALAEHDVTGGGGMSATVISAEGTWSGTTGKADDARDVLVDDQFAIASITKSVVAAQVMLMVEAGELALDDPAADHLPEDLQVAANGATVRQLLNHSSGIPDYYGVVESAEDADPLRVWTATEVLDLLPEERTAPGSSWSYADTNYMLLKLVIEHVRGQPLTAVLREGALAVEGLERLVHQPDERPTEPMAMPAGASSAALEAGGGFLPSIASATAFNGSGSIASDSLSLARWWRALCAGEIVSRASLNEMTTFDSDEHLGGYGLGMYNPAGDYGEAVGHTGLASGYLAWAACLPEDGAVIVVLTNHEVEVDPLSYVHGLARPLVEALRSV